MQTTDENLIAYNNLYALCKTLLVKLIVYGDGLTINSGDNLNDIKSSMNDLLNDRQMICPFEKHILHDSLSRLFCKLEESVIYRENQKQIKK